jgi:hypothetical protein
MNMRIDDGNAVAERIVATSMMAGGMATIGETSVMDGNAILVSSKYLKTWVSPSPQHGASGTTR